MRQVAMMLADRREFPVLEVLDALAPLAQPELLKTQGEGADVVVTRGEQTEVQTVIVPEAVRISR
jgi:hypothetical protein